MNSVLQYEAEHPAKFPSIKAFKNASDQILFTEDLTLFLVRQLKYRPLNIITKPNDTVYNLQFPAFIFVHREQIVFSM